MLESPLAPHLATPAELKARVEASRHGAPFIVLRHPTQGQLLVSLRDRDRLTIGRRAGCDLVLDWDGRVSRLHAELIMIGDEWIIADDGLSVNGTWLGETRLTGRRRLRDGDLLRLGSTVLAFCDPIPASATTIQVDESSTVRVTPAQRRVLVALCRPFLLTGRLSAPSNADIAQELFLSLDSVKTHMKALFEAFELDASAARVKRVELIDRAVRTGTVTPREALDNPGGES